MLLEVDRLDAYYRDFRALFEVSMEVAEGSTVATIGLPKISPHLVPGPGLPAEGRALIRSEARQRKRILSGDEVAAGVQPRGKPSGMARRRRKPERSPATGEPLP